MVWCGVESRTHHWMDNWHPTWWQSLIFTLSRISQLSISWFLFLFFFFLSFFLFFFNYYFRDLSELTLRFSNLIAFGWEIELVRRIKAPSPLYRYLFVWGFYFSSFPSRFFFILFPPRLYFSCTLLLHPLIFWSAIIFSNPWPEEKHAPRVHRSRALPSPPPNPPPSLLGAARINRLLKSPGSSRVCVIVFWDEENQVGSRFSSVLLLSLSLWWSMSILLDERRRFLAASCRSIRFWGVRGELGSNFSSKKSKLQSMGWKSTERRRGSCELETRMLCRTAPPSPPPHSTASASYMKPVWFSLNAPATYWRNVPPIWRRQHQSIMSTVI